MNWWSWTSHFILIWLLKIWHSSAVKASSIKHVFSRIFSGVVLPIIMHLWAIWDNETTTRITFCLLCLDSLVRKCWLITLAAATPSSSYCRERFFFGVSFAFCGPPQNTAAVATFRLAQNRWKWEILLYGMNVPKPVWVRWVMNTEHALHASIKVISLLMELNFDQ